MFPEEKSCKCSALRGHDKVSDTNRLVRHIHNKKLGCRLVLADRTAYIIEGKPLTSSRGKKAISQSDAAISNATINVTVRCNNSAHVGDGCRQKLCI